MTSSLGGYWLTEPKLRFDYENRNALSDNAYEGLRKFGPYDIADRRRQGKKIVKAVIIGRKDNAAAMIAAKEALESSRLGKFHDVFQIEITGQVIVPVQDRRTECDDYRNAIRDWLTSGPYRTEVDLAFVLHDDEEVYRRVANGMSPYYASKAVLLMAGIPTQSICYKNLAASVLDGFKKYHTSNILTACYAKVGGKPWEIQASSIDRPQITIGVATTTVHNADRIERFVGISTIFRENGAFVLWRLTNPHKDWLSYEQSLEDNICQAISAYEEKEGKQINRIACHVSGKKAGYREIAAIARALARFSGRTIIADLIHISDDAILWLYDGRDLSHRPNAGFLAQLTLDGKSALLHTEGRSNRKFPPRPLRLGVYSDTHNGCVDMYQHLYDLRWMSWRGVGTASRPVSIDYPQRMTRLLANLHKQEEVDAINFLPNLSTSAWFL